MSDGGGLTGAMDGGITVAGADDAAAEGWTGEITPGDGVAAAGGVTDGTETDGTAIDGKETDGGEIDGADTLGAAVADGVGFAGVGEADTSGAPDATAPGEGEDDWTAAGGAEVSGDGVGAVPAQRVRARRAKTATTATSRSTAMEADCLPFLLSGRDVPLFLSVRMPLSPLYQGEGAGRETRVFTSLVDEAGIVNRYHTAGD